MTLWFPFCSLLNLSNNGNIVLNIRTGFVRYRSKKLNSFLNNFIWFDSCFFKKVCIISSQLANQLGFTSGNFTVSSVGSPEINFKPKDKEKN